MLKEHFANYDFPEEPKKLGIARRKLRPPLRGQELKNSVTRGLSEKMRNPVEFEPCQPWFQLLD